MADGADPIPAPADDAGTAPAPANDAPAYQALYRRFRPQRFDEVAGQDHVTMALRNSVRDSRVTHAYLFSGPRGTGKTSTARILAKALNCSQPEGGEPCGRCEPCLAIEVGASLDVHELDAASNNGVEAMRDLVARAALGTPGRWKVYIVDEVHMLSTAASNALLKTLEEPPGHVVFVLATTDPQKVLPTVRSRASHFEFHLLGRRVLEELVDAVRVAAGLDLPPGAVDAVVRQAGGSARDALSALDQVVALGAVEEDVPALDELVAALGEQDPVRALAAVAEAAAAGRDPTRLATDLVAHLRQAFLSTMAPGTMGEADSAELTDDARRLGPALVVRAMEVIGTALVQMRDSLDPRVTLEVALVRLTRADVDDTTAALLERVERLERRMADRPGPVTRDPGGPPPVQGRQPGGGPVPKGRVEAPGAEERPARPADSARAALGALRRTQEPRPPADGDARRGDGDARRGDGDGDATPGDGPGAARAGSLPTREQLTMTWGDQLLASLRGRARALYRDGRFVAVEGGKAVFAVANQVHVSHCEAVRTEVEGVLSQHFGVRIPLSVVVDDGGGVPGLHEPNGAAPEDDELDPDSSAEPMAPGASVEERLLKVFPGAEEV